MNRYVYTCIHVDIYTHRYTYIHCIHKCIYLHKATCESVISTKFANATTLPPKPRAYLMSVKTRMIKQKNIWYSKILNHNKQMHIASKWWVKKGSHDTRQNKSQHCPPGPGTIVPRVRRSRIPGCSFAVNLQANVSPMAAEINRCRLLRGATAAGQRHWTATALSRPRRKGTDPLTQLEHASWTRVKETLDKAKIQAWFTQRDTTKHVFKWFYVNEGFHTLI